MSKGPTAVQKRAMFALATKPARLCNIRPQTRDALIRQRYARYYTDDDYFVELKLTTKGREFVALYGPMPSRIRR